ncbi:MAG: hypothetical protein WCC01_02350 [Acidimicrobiia bacterium]
MSDLSNGKAPGIVTFISILVFINAALYATVALVAIFLQGADTAAELGLDENYLLATGIVYAVVAIFTLFVGIYLLRGSRNARLIVAIVQGLGIAAVLFVMVLHHSSGFIAQGVVQIAVHSFILWSLYGNDKADAFFEAVETA